MQAKVTETDTLTLYGIEALRDHMTAAMLKGRTMESCFALGLTVFSFKNDIQRFLAFNFSLAT